MLIGADRDDLHERDAWIAGTVEEAVVQLRALAEAGVERVMLQHLLHDDLELIALLGEQVAPAVR